MSKSLSRIFTILSFLIVLISLCSLSQSSSATGDPLNPYIYVAPLIYVAKETGEMFDVDVNISNVNNLHSVEFKLSYNASLLDAVQVAQGSFLPYPPQSVVMVEINRSAGFVWMNISTVESEPGRSGNGTLARITLNVTFGAECSYSILHLRDTLLYDDSMTEISHSSIDGLYFWKSLQPDPPLLGRLLDLFTQKGGTGLDKPGGFFGAGEIVELYSYVTYNGYPVQQVPVAFQVIEPIGATILIRTSTTDQNGYANTSFRIPMIQDSYGLWTAVSVAKITNETVWDTLQFDVVPCIGGYSESVNMLPSTRARVGTYYAILVTVMASIFVIFKHKTKKDLISLCKHTNNLAKRCGEKRKWEKQLR